MTYKIICKKCKANRLIDIISNQGRDVIDWRDNNPNPTVAKIVSGRKRLDDNWGFQCICGSDDLMSDQEKKFIADKQNPSPADITRVIEDLTIQTPKFEMRRI